MCGCRWQALAGACLPSAAVDQLAGGEQHIVLLAVPAAKFAGDTKCSWVKVSWKP
jgi:hypothetical protein